MHVGQDKHYCIQAGQVYMSVMGWHNSTHEGHGWSLYV